MMKPMKVVFRNILLYTLWSSLQAGIINISLAQGFPEPLLCPHEITDFSTFSECHSEETRFAEILLPPALEQEIEKFQKEVLRPIYTDNQSNSDFLVRKSIKSLRAYRQCLIQTCTQIFQQCGRQQDSSQILEQSAGRCLSIINRLSLVQDLKIKSALTQNINRKQRSLMKQKISGVLRRSLLVFHPTITDLTAAIERFTGRVTNFIQAPKK
jgi:uncharacterized Zn ribbon protein